MSIFRSVSDIPIWDDVPTTTPSLVHNDNTIGEEQGQQDFIGDNEDNRLSSKTAVAAGEEGEREESTQKAQAPSDTYVEEIHKRSDDDIISTAPSTIPNVPNASKTLLTSIENQMSQEHDTYSDYVKGTEAVEGILSFIRSTQVDQEIRPNLLSTVSFKSGSHNNTLINNDITSTNPMSTRRQRQHNNENNRHRYRNDKKGRAPWWTFENSNQEQSALTKSFSDGSPRSGLIPGSLEEDIFRVILVQTLKDSIDKFQLDEEDEIQASPSPHERNSFETSISETEQTPSPLHLIDSEEFNTLFEKYYPEIVVRIASPTTKEHEEQQKRKERKDASSDSLLTTGVMSSSAEGVIENYEKDLADSCEKEMKALLVETIGKLLVDPHIVTTLRKVVQKRLFPEIPK
eukprot:g2378.t1